MKITKHAEKRWNERFSHLELLNEWNKSKPAGKNTRKKIKKQCPNHDMNGFKGYYYMTTKDIVFVVAPKIIIITVFPLEKYD